MANQEPLARVQRHPADNRDDIEHAEVARILSELPDNHPARAAYLSAAPETLESISLGDLITDRPDLVERLMAARISRSARTRALRCIRRDSHNNCSICGQRFKKGESAYMGQDAEGKPLYVGDCCAVKIRNLDLKESWGSWDFEIPSAHAQLWRYMDFAKFVSMLHARALYFPRADTLGDPFEGAQGIESNREQWRAKWLEITRNAARKLAASTNRDQPEWIEQRAQQMVKEFSEHNEGLLHHTYISCWHASDVESEALWRLYCPVGSSGLAVRTTKGALQNALGDDPDVLIGTVEYIDFETEFAGMNLPVFRKRKSLQHETEVRAVTQLRRFPYNRTIVGPVGISKPVDLALVLQEIVISPFAPPWFTTVLIGTLSTFGVSAPISSSKLLRKPFY